MVGKAMEKYRIFSASKEGGERGRVSLVLPHERVRKVRDIQKSPGVIHHPWMIASCRESYSFQCVHSWPWLKDPAIFPRLLSPSDTPSLPPVATSDFLMLQCFYNLWNTWNNGEEQQKHLWLRFHCGDKRGKWKWKFLLIYIIGFVNFYLVMPMIEWKK